MELQKDLSVKQQLLDVVIIEKHSGQPLKEWPDGFDDLAKHNLLTYKSHRQILDEWAIHELIGHYVNYRKQVGQTYQAMNSSPDNLMPFGDFRRYAVAARFPNNLAAAMPFEPVTEGVFDIRWGNMKVRIIILSRISDKPENAIWQMYSAIPEKVQSAAKLYRWRKRDVSSIINQLFKNYRIEGFAMPYTVEDYQKDYVREHISKLPPDEVLEKFTADDLLKRLTTEELYKRLAKSVEGLSRQESSAKLRKLLPELTPEKINALTDILLPGK